MLRITVSFKNTTKDMKIYNEINSKEEKSEFVKDAVRFYVEHLESINKGV